MRAHRVACACLLAAAAVSAQNLVTNGSFEGNLTGWDFPDTTTYDPTLDATGTAGSGSAKSVLAPGQSRGVVMRCVGVSGSAAYAASGKVRIPAGQATTGDVKIYLNFYSGSDCSGESLSTYQTQKLTSTSGWESLETGSVTSPAGANSAVFAAWAANRGAAGSSSFQVNVDDLYLGGAAGASYARWVPAVIHKDVPSKNAKWRSDVAILNCSNATANLTITMHAGAGPVTQTAQLPAKVQFLLTDLAGWLGVTSDSGPLEVVSDREFYLSGRTYNQVDETHTYGQNYEGEDPSDLLGAQQSAWLPQLTEDALYRTNIGITNTGTATANVTLTLYDASGSQVWQDSRDYAAGGFFQYQQPFLPLGGITSGFARVTVNSGSGVVAYASVTDNNTGDPTTITMKR